LLALLNVGIHVAAMKNLSGHLRRERSQAGEIGVRALCATKKYFKAVDGDLDSTLGLEPL